MYKHRLIPLLFGLAFGLAVAPAEAGWCFCWSDDGSASHSAGPADDQADCNTLCIGYSQIRYVPGDLEQEGPDGSLPVTRSPDSTDLDGDGDTTEIIRWRYVVVVGMDPDHPDPDCDDTGETCKEWHRLYKCWRDDDPVPPDGHN